jgi:hypothetical protein
MIIEDSTGYCNMTVVSATSGTTTSLAITNTAFNASEIEQGDTANFYVPGITTALTSGTISGISSGVTYTTLTVSVTTTGTSTGPAHYSLIT